MTGRSDGKAKVGALASSPASSRTCPFSFRIAPPKSRAMSLNKKFPRLLPSSIGKGWKVTDLVDNSFKAYNGGRLAEACRLFTQKMVAGNGTVGMSLTGALTPAGLGKAAIIPLMKAGFVDWIISTGANLYHDMHYGLGMEMYALSLIHI